MIKLEFSIDIFLARLLLAVGLVLAAPVAVVAAEEVRPVSAIDETDVQTTAQQAGAGEAKTAAAPLMSSTSAEDSVLVESGNNGAFSAMAAGSCLVVDQFVRQYCMSNPDDISCQIQ